MAERWLSGQGIQATVPRAFTMDRLAPVFRDFGYVTWRRSFPTMLIHDILIPLAIVLGALALLIFAAWAIFAFSCVYSLRGLDLGP